jgi:beta-carotene 3-hydroxylase
MADYIINFSIVLAAFMGMECVAWLAHKYIMHGFGWFLHKDHHEKGTEAFFERNDFFFLVFALPGIIGLFLGMRNDYNFLFWIGLGITFYGAAYFLVHDIFIHQRFKFFRNTDSVYLRAIRKAHKVHHKHLGKYHGESFGMLWVPFKHFRAAMKSTGK